MRPPIMTLSQVAHCQSKLTEHCIIANKDGVSNIKKCIPVDPSIIHACVQHTYLHMHNTLYSPSEGIRKREKERLECRLGQDRGLGGKLELGF